MTSTADFNYYKHLIDFLCCQTVDRFLHQKEALIDDFNLHLYSKLSNDLKDSKHEISKLYEEKIIITYLIHVMGRYVQTNDVNLLKEATEIVFNADIYRCSSTLLIKPYRAIVYKRISHLVSNGDVGDHNDFFNACIEDYTFMTKNDSQENILEYSKEQMYQDMCDQLAVLIKNKNLNISVFFDISKHFDPDDSEEYTSLRKHIANFKKRKQDDTVQDKTLASSPSKYNKIARLDNDKDVSTRNEETNLSQSLNENSNTSSKENASPAESAPKPFSASKAKPSDASSYPSVSSPKAKTPLANNDKNNNNIMVEESPRKLSLRSSQKSKEVTPIAVSYVESKSNEPVVDPHNFDSMFNYENDIPSDKEEATTSKNVNKMLSKSPAKKKIFKRDYLIADNIFKSTTKQTSDQDSEVQIDSDLDFDKSTNAETSNKNNKNSKAAENIKKTVTSISYLIDSSDESIPEKKSKKTAPLAARKERIALTYSSDTDSEIESKQNEKNSKKTHRTFKKPPPEEAEEKFDKDAGELENIEETDSDSKETATATTSKRKPARVKWNDTETFHLVLGHKIYNGTPNVWAKILERYKDKFHTIRNSVSLKDKWRNLENNPLDMNMFNARVNDHLIKKNTKPKKDATNTD